ncbi:MAG: AAA family ATPase [Lachnospiraceae bacterium]|jgi:DNA repair exonuclease SbcCD ATPase subunit|nr:AAA family ATPase [Lachnospiraceae bacterium]
MKLNYLKINGFGKLENKEIELNKNINLIHGKNEAGKTTLLKFISSMFYGISKNKNGKDYSDHEKYSPWIAEDFSGKLNYELDNGDSFELFRDFNKKMPKLYDIHKEDIVKNYSIDKTKGSNFFFEQTNLSEEILFSTLISEQTETSLNTSKQNTLMQKVTNIISSGEENTSIKKALDTLGKKITEEIGTSRTTGKPINLIDAEISSLEKEKINIKNYETDLNEINININNLENKKDIINSKINISKIILKNKSDENIEKEKLNVNKTILNECLEKISEKNNTNNKQDIKSNNRKINIPIIFSGLFLLFLFLNIFIIKSDLFLIISILGLISSLLIYFFKNKLNINAEKIIANSKELELLINTKISQEEKTNKLEDNLKELILINKKNIINNYTNLLEEQDISFLLEKNIDELNYHIQFLEKELNNLTFEIHSLTLKKDTLINQIENNLKIEENLNSLYEQKQELNKLENYINLAKLGLDEAYSKMKNTITPKFTNELNNLIKSLTNGKYNNIIFNDTDGLVVELENGDYINCSKLSVGTIDQMYLSLRLAISKEIFSESFPLILDESFAYYDTERLENILKYISSEFKNMQVIIFTCTNREKDILNKLNINYNYVEL